MEQHDLQPNGVPWFRCATCTEHIMYGADGMTTGSCVSCNMNFCIEDFNKHMVEVHGFPPDFDAEKERNKPK